VSTERTIVIVGASLAGAQAAEALRREGFDGPVVLVGEEAERPYERPPLSKDFLRGKAGREKVYVHDEGFYADQDIELRTSTRVVAIDPAAGQVRLEDGEPLPYHRLLLTTGAAPRRTGPGFAGGNGASSRPGRSGRRQATTFAGQGRRAPSHH
jgi:3-phenylpropionate/trans-cinnamate dioxygenase ferredoxin reductase subunit